MSLFDHKTLFSEVNGVVLKDGKPVANAEVVRYYHWHWKDSKSTESTTTNDKGEFHFEAVREKSMTASLMFHEPLITQEIKIRLDDQEYKAWRFTKHDYQNNGELNGRAIKMTCDLETEPSFKDDVFGICTLEK